MRTKEFPIAPLERIAKKAGAKRISSKAAESLRDIVLEKANDIASNAVIMSKHAGRLTVKKSDIKLATAKFNYE